MGAPTRFDWLAAAHTPFDSSGQVYLDAVELQASHLADHGLRGVFICGTTGEGLSLSVGERMLLAARWSEVLAGSDLSLWVHVGANALPDVQELASHAAKVGASAIALMPPCFYRPEDEEHLVAWCEAASVASGGMPLSLYESPEMTGVRLDIERFNELARLHVAGYRGLKFTDSNLELFTRLCAGTREGEGMWWGRDEELQAGISAGATGAIGSSYNFAAPVYEPIIAGANGEVGGDTQEAQDRAISIIEIIANHGYLPAAKAVMEMIGVPVGPARAPLSNLDDAAKDQLRAELEHLGFFDWISS